MYNFFATSGASNSFPALNALLTAHESQETTDQLSINTWPNELSKIEDNPDNNNDSNGNEL